MNKNLFIGAVVVLVIIAGVFLMKNNSAKQMAGSTINNTGAELNVNTSNTTAQVQTATAEPTGTAGASTADKSEAKVFDIKASNFKFDVKEIKVKQGDKVKINLTRAQGFHDWVIDEFNAKTAQLGEGKTDSAEFTADKKGTFEYYCSVGSHRKMGMVGKLIVE